MEFRFAVLPMGVHPAYLDPALGVLRKVHDELLKSGAKRYPSGWLFEPGLEAWKVHFGELFENYLATKKLLDPQDIFCNLLDIKNV